jgi:holo-ACP synthase/triphosphoribosyl-dephospho-CoA synthase
MIARGGMEKASAAKAVAYALWPDGPVPEQLPPLAALAELDEDFIRDHLSPGGCADLLAISFFLYYLNEENTKWQM